MARPFHPVPAVRITRACRDASTCGRGMAVHTCPRVRCAEQDDPYSPAQPHRDVVNNKYSALCTLRERQMRSPGGSLVRHASAGGLARRIRARDWLRRQARTPASGQVACAPARTRSARPTCRPPAISSAPNHTSRPSSTPAALAETAGRSPAGTKGPRFRAASGQAARAIKPTAAQKVCGSEPPPPAGSGFAATSTVATPPAIKMSRPAKAAGLSASPVRTWQAPTPASASVITHRPVAPCAARELIVPADRVEGMRVQPGSHRPAACQ